MVKWSVSVHSTVCLQEGPSVSNKTVRHECRQVSKLKTKKKEERKQTKERHKAVFTIKHKLK